MRSVVPKKKYLGSIPKLSDSVTQGERIRIRLLAHPEKIGKLNLLEKIGKTQLFFLKVEKDVKTDMFRREQALKVFKCYPIIVIHLVRRNRDRAISWKI